MGFCVSGEMSLCIHVCLYFLMCVFVCVRQRGERASLERQWDAVLKERKKGRQKERMHHHWICVKIATQQMQWLECNLSGYITMCLRVCACKYMCMHLHLFLCLSQIFSPIWSLCRTSCPLCISCSACRYSFFLLLKLPNCFTDWFGFFHKKETILQFYPAQTIPCEPETFLPWFVDSLAHFNGVICFTLDRLGTITLAACFSTLLKYSYLKVLILDRDNKEELPKETREPCQQY